MKKIFSFLLLLTTTFSFIIAQTIEEQERELFKKYQVKERISYDFPYKDGVMEKHGVKTSMSKYNRSGLVVMTFTFNAKGDTTVKEYYGYDARGNRVLYERYSVSGEYKKTSEYDMVDNIILEAGYDGSASFKTVYTYEKGGKVMEIKYYVDNLLDEKRVYSYSGKNATVSVLHKGKDPKSTIQLIFDDKGQILKETTLGLDGTELERRVLQYNAKGQVLLEEKYRLGKLNNRLEYIYNANGDLIKLSEDTGANDKYDKKLYEYDTQGRVSVYKWKRKTETDYNLKKYTYGSSGVCVEEYTNYPKTNYKLLTRYEYTFY